MKFTKILGLLTAAVTLSLASCGKEPSKPQPQPEPEVHYTAEKVSEDFNANLEEAGLGDYAISWDAEYEEYSGFFLIDQSEDEGEENLYSAAATIASFLPDYMEPGYSVYGDPTSEDYEDIFGDQSYYYYMDFDSSDELSYAVIISYCYLGYLCAQISVADNVE